MFTFIPLTSNIVLKLCSTVPTTQQRIMMPYVQQSGQSSNNGTEDLENSNISIYLQLVFIHSQYLFIPSPYLFKLFNGFKGLQDAKNSYVCFFKAKIESLIPEPNLTTTLNPIFQGGWNWKLDLKSKVFSSLPRIITLKLILV